MTFAWTFRSMFARCMVNHDVKRFHKNCISWTAAFNKSNNRRIWLNNNCRHCRHVYYRTKLIMPADGSLRCNYVDYMTISAVMVRGRCWTSWINYCTIIFKANYMLRIFPLFAGVFVVTLDLVVAQFFKYICSIRLVLCIKMVIIIGICRCG